MSRVLLRTFESGAWRVMKNRQSPSAASIASRCQYDCVAPVPLRGQKIVGEWRERASSSCSLRSRRRRGGSEVRGERIEVRKPRSPSRPLSLSRFLDVLFALQTSYLSPLSPLVFTKDGSMLRDKGRRTAFHGRNHSLTTNHQTPIFLLSSRAPTRDLLKNRQ